MQITVLFPDETWSHRELCNLHWIYPYPIANLWQGQKISLKHTWPTEAAFSCVIHLSALSPGFWRFKGCMQKAASLSEWNSITLSSSRAGSTLGPSGIHSETELNFSVPLVLGWSFGTEHPSRFLHSSIMWNCMRPWPAPHGLELGLQPSPKELGFCSPSQLLPTPPVFTLAAPSVPTSCKAYRWSQTT